VDPIRVGVIEENDIFRRGVVACLADDPDVVVVFEGTTGPVVGDAVVGVVSHRAASTERLACPLVVCSADGRAHPGAYEPNSVVGFLPRSTLTAEQLVATVRAAAAGLRVQPRDAAPPVPHDLDDRCLEVLRMLSRGDDTQQISHALCYSERTVKAVISEIQRSLGARNRTHAVAEGIRNGFI
jgi:DNA-binding CsgD family transcriptional regulator